MLKNDCLILDAVIDSYSKGVPELANRDRAFFYFSVEQVLKDFGLTFDEITTGCTDGGDDGGVDGVYLFINDELVNDDFDAEGVKSKPNIQLFILQTKLETSYKEGALDKLIITLGKALDLSDDENLGAFNIALQRLIRLFRKSYVMCASRHPRLEISVLYVCRGEPAAAHAKVNAKLTEIDHLVRTLVPAASSSCRLIGARDLIEAAQTEKSYSISLPFVEILISQDQSSYVTLVRLSDYVNFISQGTQLRKHLFEWNVRDWQGDVEVNREIESTVAGSDTIDFWWLNNGVSVICSDATIAGKVIALSDVQIVNGLQTSVSIHNAFDPSAGSKKDERSLLVKIVKTSDAAVRDKIIKATNYQTAIQPASLKATDSIQRDIENYFLRFGWYYDRRKNFYKNTGKPSDRIISISYLAQATMAIMLQQPDNARARPSTLIKRNEDYRQVFNPAFELSIFLFCAELMKWIEQSIRVDTLSAPAFIMREFRFHMAYAYATFGTGNPVYEVRHLAPVLSEKLVDSIRAHAAMEFVMKSVFSFENDRQEFWSIDRIAKSSDFVRYLAEAMRNDIEHGEGLRFKTVS